MKLQDLESSSLQKSQKVLESYFEKKIDVSTLTQEQALAMLKKVKGVVEEARSTKGLHTSEKNPSYLRAIFLEQALESWLHGSKPTVNTVPVMEAEVQQAQVVLAAQDMVDRVQGMIEDITEMEYKDLPALVESIRNEIGTSQAQSYREQATTSLEGLVEALQNAKSQLESAQGILTGQEPVVPGEDEMDVDMSMDVDGDTADAEMDVDMDADADDDTQSDLEASLGRARR